MSLLLFLFCVTAAAAKYDEEEEDDTHLEKRGEKWGNEKMGDKAEYSISFSGENEMRHFKLSYSRIYVPNQSRF